MRYFFNYKIIYICVYLSFKYLLYLMMKQVQTQIQITMLKKSQHLGLWKQRFIEIKQNAIRSYREKTIKDMHPSFIIPIQKITKITLYSPQLVEGTYRPVLKVQYGKKTYFSAQYFELMQWFKTICRAKAREKNKFSLDNKIPGELLQHGMLGRYLVYRKAGVILKQWRIEQMTHSIGGQTVMTYQKLKPGKKQPDPLWQESSKNMTKIYSKFQFHDVAMIFKLFTENGDVEFAMLLNQSDIIDILLMGVAKYAK